MRNVPGRRGVRRDLRCPGSAACRPSMSPLGPARARTRRSGLLSLSLSLAQPSVHQLSASLTAAARAAPQRVAPPPCSPASLLFARSAAPAILHAACPMRPVPRPKGLSIVRLGPSCAADGAPPPPPPPAASLRRARRSRRIPSASLSHRHLLVVVGLVLLGGVLLGPLLGLLDRRLGRAAGALLGVCALLRLGRQPLLRLLRAQRLRRLLLRGGLCLGLLLGCFLLRRLSLCLRLLLLLPAPLAHLAISALRLLRVEVDAELGEDVVELLHLLRLELLLGEHLLRLGGHEHRLGAHPLGLRLLLLLLLVLFVTSSLPFIVILLVAICMFLLLRLRLCRGLLSARPFFFNVSPVCGLCIIEVFVIVTVSPVRHGNRSVHYYCLLLLLLLPLLLLPLLLLLVLLLLLALVQRSKHVGH
mmetsp:Transcript_16171/g.35138  ORF Transcript_16171/g.35138 Transcript_16171/m.35138 type:complete len:417 (-) Transcript_16171:278-1528(-)